MAIFNGYVSLPEGNHHSSYGNLEVEDLATFAAAFADCNAWGGGELTRGRGDKHMEKPWGNYPSSVEFPVFPCFSEVLAHSQVYELSCMSYLFVKHNSCLPLNSTSSIFFPAEIKVPQGDAPLS
jgi:hypothetical protein